MNVLEIHCFFSELQQQLWERCCDYLSDQWFHICLCSNCHILHHWIQSHRKIRWLFWQVSYQKKKHRIYICLFGWGSSLSLTIMLLSFLNNYSSWPTWYQTTHYSRKSKSPHMRWKLFVPLYFLHRCRISNHILHYSLAFPKVIGEEEDIPYLNGFCSCCCFPETVISSITAVYVQFLPT